jgi:hypothetical protein
LGYAANKDRKNLGTAWRWGLDNKGWPKGVNPFLSVKKNIRSLGLEETRGALEEGLKGPAQVIEFKKVNAV